MNLTQYPDMDLMAIAIADKISSQLLEQLFHNERALLIVPGGSTPQPIFDVLCSADLPWDRVDITASDERWVEPESPRSNASMIRRHLMQSRAANATFLDLYMANHSPEQAAGLLSQRLAPRLPAAVAVMGMGADMHTASLFPGGTHLTEALQEDAPAVLPMQPADRSLETRVTLSMPVLKGAIQQHVVFSGDEKLEIFKQSVDRPVSEAPVMGLLGTAEFHWAAS